MLLVLNLEVHNSVNVKSIKQEEILSKLQLTARDFFLQIPLCSLRWSPSPSLNGSNVYSSAELSPCNLFSCSAALYLTPSYVFYFLPTWKQLFSEAEDDYDKGGGFKMRL